MGETEFSKTTVDVYNNKRNGHGEAFDSAFSTFFMQFPHRFQNFVKVSVISFEVYNGLPAFSLS